MNGQLFFLLPAFADLFSEESAQYAHVKLKQKLRSYQQACLR